MCCLTSSVASFLARLAPGLGGREDVLAAAAALVPVLGMVAVAEGVAGAELTLLRGVYSHQTPHGHGANHPLR